MANVTISRGPGESSFRTVSCETGMVLMDVLTGAGVFTESPCGGRGICGKCKVRICPQGDPGSPGTELTKAERSLLKPEEIASGIRLACMTRITGDCLVELPETGKEQRILTDGYLPEFIRDHREGYGIAADIGTTTIAMSLIDLASGKELSTASAVNAQKQYGLDVLSRISFETEHGDNAIHILQKVLVDSCSSLIREVCGSAGVAPDCLKEIVIAANCCMTHMLLGRNATGLGKAPYTPVFTEAQSLPAREIGLKAGPDTVLYCLPQVSAYIGGDIVAGAAVCRLNARTGNVLFIDVGTNGEIVLARNGRLLCCSCAAGPALEGMNISCGMRASVGAVEDVRIGTQAELTTIGGTPPAGLCGSGILAAVRELLKGGYIKKTGAFVSLSDQPEPALLRACGTKREAVLNRSPELVVTQDDVRQVQLAKGAILSGFRVLLQEAGICMEDLDQVIVAGQFGAHLPAESLTGTGILPEELKDRIVYAGNTSRSGACMALLSLEERRNMEALAKEMDYTDLARTADYERIFAGSMKFPAGV